MPKTQATDGKARVGDLVEARGLYGQPPRRGEIIELVGRGAHERYRVRWDEQHESIVYPADGVLVVDRQRRRSRRSA